MGTRDLCLERSVEAADRLREALRIRESIGDEAGAAVTRHNLDVLGVPPTVEERDAPPDDRVPPNGDGSVDLWRWARPAGIAGTVALVVGISYLMIRNGEPDRAGLDFLPNSLQFAEQLIGTRSDPQTLRITNLGGSELRIGNLEIAAGTGFELGAVECGPEVPVPPGGSCSAEVFFHPTAPGSSQTRLAVLDPAGTLIRDVPIHGLAMEPPVDTIASPEGTPAIAISAGELRFGPQRVGAPGAERSLTVTSSGTAPLRIDGVGVVGAAAADFVVDSNCAGQSADAGVACGIRIAFSPSAPGSRSASLQLATNAGPRTIPLSGVGVTGALVVQPGLVEFDSVTTGSRAVRTVTLENAGSAPLAIHGIELAGSAPSPFTLRDGCSGTDLGVGQRCVVELAFTPRDPGAADAALVVRHDAGPDPHTLALAGRGFLPAVAAAELNRTEIEFGRVQVVPEGGQGFLETLIGALMMRAVAITSAGTAPLVVRAVEVRGPSADDFIVDSDACTRQPIAPSGRCEVSVRFAPRATGTRTAVISITDNTGAGPHRVALTGVGLAREPELPDLQVVSIEQTSIGEPAEGGGFRIPVRVTVRNTGGAEAGIFSVSLEAADIGPVRFLDPRQPNRFAPITRSPLRPNQQVDVVGEVRMATVPGEQVRLRAIADSCVGEELMPVYCRVEESNEENNVSRWITARVRLPVID